MHKPKPHNLVAAALGYLGAADSLVMGYYVVATLLQLMQFPHSESLILLSYAAAVSAGFSFLTLAFGSFLLMRDRKRKGLVMNCAGAICLTLTYFYFALFSQPILLGWLGIRGYFLIAPPLLSVIVALLTK